MPELLRGARDGSAAVGHRGRAPGHRRDDPDHDVRERHGATGVPRGGPPVRVAVPGPDEAGSRTDPGVQVRGDREAVDLPVTGGLPGEARATARPGRRVTRRSVKDLHFVVAGAYVMDCFVKTS